MSFGLYSCGGVAPGRSGSTALMSYNVRNGEGLDRLRQYSRTAAVITGCKLSYALTPADSITSDHRPVVVGL